MVIEPQQVFVPLTIKQLDIACAFLREQTEDGVDDCHPDFFGIRSAGGVYRSALPYAEAVDPETAIIERIDAEQQDLADELDQLNDVKLALDQSTVKPHFDEVNTAPGRINGFRASNNGHRVSMRRSTGIDFMKETRRPQGWKDRLRVRRQHLRHPHRIARNVLTADAS